MPVGYNIRLDVGSPPKVRRYRYGQVTTGPKLIAARIGATVKWQRGTMELGGWLSAALVSTLLEEIASAILDTAPVGPDPPTHPAWSGHVHMRDSINTTMHVKGKGDINGTPDATSRSHAYGEIFVGFPWRFLEYGTVKMSARPFVEPAYEAGMARYGQIVADLRGKFLGGGSSGGGGGGRVGEGSLGGVV